MEDERQMLLRIIEGQNALLQTQAEQIKALTEKIDALLKELEEKKHKKNSRNSSAPPSSDGYAKPTPKSQRKIQRCKARRTGWPQGQLHEAHESTRRNSGALPPGMQRMPESGTLPWTYCRAAV